MLQYVNSSLFSSPARVLVNTVNTVGVMGKGIALEFKKRCPAMYEEYRELCRSGDLEIGRLWLWRTPDRWVLNFPTKKHWRNPSKPEYVEKGLLKFYHAYRDYGIDSISFPLLGCGNGGLDFETQVRPLMERYLGSLPIPIYIHVRTEGAKFIPEHEEPDLLNSKVLPDSFVDFWRDLRQLSERNPELRLQTLAEESPFRLALVDRDRLIFIRGANGDDRRVHIPMDDIRALWNRLRITGSIKSTEAPGRIGREYSLVFPLLAALTYVEPVELADDYESLRDRPFIGLQVRPSSSEAQHGSSSEAVAVG